MPRNDRGYQPSGSFFKKRTEEERDRSRKGKEEELITFPPATKHRIEESPTPAKRSRNDRNYSTLNSRAETEIHRPTTQQEQERSRRNEEGRTERKSYH